jgi:hypothetical protein
MGWTAFSTQSFAFYALEIIGHLPLRIPCTNATYATSALITRIRTPQAPQARMFLRLMHNIHATLASSAVHCHHEFASLHALEVTLSLAYCICALPLFKRECSRASRAYSALFTRHRHITLALLQSSPYQSGSHHHHIPECLLCLHTPESLRALPLHKRECSRASRAYVALFTRHSHITLASLQSSPYHSGSCHYHIPELTLCLHTPESLRAFRCSTALSRPLRLTPAPFPRLARHHYASLASSHSPQPHSHYTPLTSHTLITTSLVHHLMH